MKRHPHIPVPSPQAKWEGKKPAKRLKLEAAPEAGADGDAGEAEEVWHIDAGAMGAFVHGLEDEFYEVGVSRFGLGLGLEDPQPSSTSTTPNLPPTNPNRRSGLRRSTRFETLPSPTGFCLGWRSRRWWTW